VGFYPAGYFFQKRFAAAIYGLTAAFLVVGRSLTCITATAAHAVDEIIHLLFKFGSKGFMSRRRGRRRSERLRLRGGRQCTIYEKNDGQNEYKPTHT